jgi:hypothetical protein
MAKAHNRLDLVGQRFGKLMVNSFAGVASSNRESLWFCKCGCGNTSTVRGSDLKQGNTKSCGCYHKERTRQLFSKSDDEIRINRVWFDYRKRAKNKSMDFSLTKEHFTKLLNSNCYYCGGVPKNSLVQHGKKLNPYQGIDRLDNDKGYVPSNVVPCCIICNKMKKAMNESEFIAHIKKIVKKQKLFNI